ncbi:MAG: hypothetical protein R2932_13815 [Caldilineaceae bacterium]
MNRLLTPYVIAQTIRSLDSRLVTIKFEEVTGKCRLVYCYEVAGRIEHFYIPLTGSPVDSITALYPQAQMLEEQLHLTYGIQFRPCPNQPRQK